VLPAAATIVAWAVMWLVPPLSDTSITDVFIYERYADFLSTGSLPYTGFAFEYPPLAILPMWGADALGGGYEVAFGVLMGVCAVLCTALAGALGGPRAGWAMAAAPLLAGAVLRTHFDLFAVVLLLAGLALVRTRRTTYGFGLLGLATMTKLFPIVVAGIVAAWLWGRGERAAAAWGMAACALVVAAVSLPFLGDGYADAYRYHLDRPVQVESTPASVLWVLGDSDITGTTEHPDEFGSNGMVGGAADTLRALSGVLQAAALLLCLFLATRRRDERQLLLCAAGAVVAFVALGKVLSPQYVAWLAPFAALLLARGERLAAALLAVAIALTTVEFPRFYLDLVEGSGWVALLVGVRNAALLAALGVILATAAGAARSRSPAAAAPST
jgi:hypothetical protein